MKPIDRRGLAETVAWSLCLSSVTILIVVAMVTQHDTVLPWLLPQFGGLVVALAARGTKGAIDRDAQKDRDSK